MSLIPRLVPIVFLIRYVEDTDEFFMLKEPSREKEHPYAVVVYIAHSGKLCSGSILASYWVLTAAHCIDILSLFFPVLIKVIAGIINTRELIEETFENSTTYNQTSGAMSVYLYPGFKYDAALLKMMSPFHFDEFVQPVQIAAKPFPSRSEICVAVGYGRRHVKGGLGIQHWVDLMALDVTKCKKDFLSKNVTLHMDSVICAKGDNGRGMCSGDSGSPLVCQGVQAGILSAGIFENGSRRPNRPTDCGSQDVVTVYVFTGDLVPWISDIIPDLPKAVQLDNKYKKVMPRSQARRPTSETLWSWMLFMYLFTYAQYIQLTERHVFIFSV